MEEKKITKKKVDDTEKEIAEYVAEKKEVQPKNKKSFKVILVNSKWVIFDVGGTLSHTPNIWGMKLKAGDEIQV